VHRGRFRWQACVDEYDFPVNTSPRKALAVRWIVAAAAASMAIAATWIYERVRVGYPLDWVIYRYGSAAAWQGMDLYDTPVRGEHLADMGVPFIYPPFGALVLWPTNLGTQHDGLWAWSIASMLALLAATAMVTPPDARNRWVVAFAVASVACATIMVYENFACGQINLLLMVLVIGDLTRSDDTAFGRWVPRGVLIGLAAAIKLTPGLLIVYLALARQWRMFWCSVAACLGAFAVAFALRPQLTIAFFSHGMWHVTDRVVINAIFATSTNSSIAGMLAAVGDWSRPLSAVLTVGATVVGLLVARRAAARSGLLAGGLIIAVTATMVSPIGWINHWVYLVPAGIYIWFHRGWCARAVVIAGTLLTVFADPYMGDRWLAQGSVLGSFIGWPLREMLLLLGSAAIAIIGFGEEKPGQARSEEDRSACAKPVGRQDDVQPAALS
jgi:alpha-1,2-mannosyltransferase